MSRQGGEDWGLRSRGAAPNDRAGPRARFTANYAGRLPCRACLAAEPPRGNNTVDDSSRRVPPPERRAELMRLVANTARSSARRAARPLRRFLGSHGAVESIRKQVEEHTTIREEVSTSVGLPLTDESKRVLEYAADESERLNHNTLALSTCCSACSARRNALLPKFCRSAACSFPPFVSN